MPQCCELPVLTVFLIPGSYEKLAHVARTYDKNYCHFTTRQNIQFNWPKLEEVPDILAELASVQMHAIQTSVTAWGTLLRTIWPVSVLMRFEDPRPYCEIIRQWTTLHPEFDYLPRKFKIAVSGALTWPCATQFHDIGLHLVKNDVGEVGFKSVSGRWFGPYPRHRASD